MVIKNPPLKKHVDIPIYPVRLYLIVSNDIVAERVKMSDVFGPISVGCQRYVDTLCSYLGNNVGLFFTPNTIPGVVAHEIYHITNRIMEFIGCRHSHEYSEEAYAYLLTWITNWVNKEWVKK